MREEQLDLVLAPLHPLAERLIPLQRTWTRGRPKGLAPIRIRYRCTLAELVEAHEQVRNRFELPEHLDL